MSLSSRLSLLLSSPRFARATARLRKPRHPLTRFALGLAGLSLLALLVILGAFVGLAMLLLGLLARLWHLRGRPLSMPARGDILEGRYRVLRRPAVPHAG